MEKIKNTILNRKKIIFSIIVVLIAILGYKLFCLSLVGKMYLNGDYLFKIEKDHAVLKEYTGTSEIVKIPKKIAEKPVTEIFYNAFSGNLNIREVEFPSTMRIIDNHAFDHCSNLEKIKFNGCLDEIRYRAFGGCEKLTELEFFPNSKTQVFPWAFESCSNLKTVNVNNAPITLEWYAFASCLNLLEIVGADNMRADIGSFFHSGLEFTEKRENGFTYFSNFLLGYTGNEKDIYIPEGIRFISYRCFGYLDYYDVSGIHFPKGFTTKRFLLEFNKDMIKKNGKVKLYFANTEAFFEDYKDNTDELFFQPNANENDEYINFLIEDCIIVGPEDSAAVQFAKNHGIEYTIEES